MIIDHITKSDFENIKNNRIPTLIKNGLDIYPILKKWNIDC